MSIQESDKIFSNIEIDFNILTQHFDQREFKKSPIKNLINTDLFFTLEKGKSNNFIYKLSRNIVKLQESMLTDLLPPLE